MTDKCIEQEVETIKYFRMRMTTMTGRDVGIEEAGELFTRSYAEKYREIWYDGISQEDIRIKLFYPGRDR